MKKLFYLLVFIMAFSFHSKGQSGQWKLNIDATLINKMGYDAGSSSSFYIDLSVNNGSWIRVLDTTTPTKRDATTIKQVSTGPYPLTSRVTKIQVYTKFDKSNATDPNQGTYCSANFQTTTEKIKYKAITYPASQIYKTYEGDVRAYASPCNINIVQRSPNETGVSAEDKVIIEAPNAYDASVYRWVYRTNTYEAWKPVSNTSLNGNYMLQATLADIYGSNFMNDGVVNFSSNTYLALEYDTYSSRTSPMVKAYSNIITVSNKLIAPKIVSVEDGKTACPGYSNGKIRVTVDRPLLSQEKITFYAYTADGIAGTQRDYIQIDPLTYEIINLPVGVYTVEFGTRYGATGISANVSDANNKRTGIAVTEPDPISYTVNGTDIRNISCKGGNDGSFKVTAGGGTGVYTLWWEPDEFSNFIPVPDNRLEVSGLKAGTYRYYVIDSNNCELADPVYGGVQYQFVTLTEPAESLAVSLLPDKTANPTGYGRSDGYITVKMSGGTAPYTVAWQEKTTGNVLTTVDNGTVGESRLYNIVAGTYTATVTDSKGCTFYTASGFTLVEPPVLKVTINQQGQILCYGDASVNLTASASGGIGAPYTYSWSKNVSGVYAGVATGSSLNNQGAGEYKVVASDSSTPPNTAEGYITVSQPALLTTSVIKVKNISCFGGSDGAVYISVTGGSGGYKLYYKNENVDANYKQLPVTLPDNVFYLDNLLPGKYSLYIRDANGCTAQIAGQDVAEFELTAPEKPLSIVSLQINPPTGAGRNDGSILITVDGGTPFDSGDKYRVLWKDVNGNPVTPQNSQNAQGLFTSEISNLPDGEYRVEIRDKNYQDLINGCYFTTEITLDEPQLLTATVENTKTISCFGDSSGELVAHVLGGIPYNSGLPYKYAWYCIEKEGDEILLENETDSILSNIPAGMYKVVIADGSLVTNYGESEIFTLSQPEKLLASVDTRMISCYQGSDGYIHLSTTGGTGNCKLYYKLNGIDADYHEITGSGANSTLEINNLQAGIYSLYIQDENLCYGSIDGVNIAEIELTQPEKALSIVSDTIYDPTGYGLSNGEIHVGLDGGTPGYTVIWRNNNGNVLTATDSVIDGVFSSVLTGLGEGKYSIEVRDANYPKADDSNNTACILIKDYELVQPEELTLALEETHYISCYQMSDGEITAHVRGGTGPYKYTWYREEAGSFAVVPDRNDSILTNIPAGTYRLEIEDCARIPNTVSATHQVVQPELLTATAEDVRVVCGEVAAISVTASGGTKPYIYKWNMGNTTPEVNGMGPGKYMALVTDARGCEATAIVQVTSPSNLSLNAEINNPVCYQSNTGSIAIGITGGTAPYTYKWNTGETTRDIENIGAGVYAVTVTDNDGCTFTESFELTDPEPLKVDLGEDIILCLGQSYLLEPQVEDPKTVFNWTGPDGFRSTDSKVELTQAGTYQLTITDSKGCRATDDVQVLMTDYVVNAEMAVATNTFVNDTIVLVNISSPEPDRIEWLFSDKDPVEIVEISHDMAEIIFRQTGEYTVGMRSFVGDCYQDVTKILNVTEADENGNDNFGPAGVKEFTAYPNPNNGSFNVKVELDKQSAIRLCLFSINQGNLIDDRTVSGLKLYNEQYQRYLSPGVYLLLLETPSGRKSQKVIIK